MAALLEDTPTHIESGLQDQELKIKKKIIADIIYRSFFVKSKPFFITENDGSSLSRRMKVRLDWRAFFYGYGL